jgi:hypothetical protein
MEKEVLLALVFDPKPVREGLLEKAIVLPLVPLVVAAYGVRIGNQTFLYYCHSLLCCQLVY